MQDRFDAELEAAFNLADANRAALEFTLISRNDEVERANAKRGFVPDAAETLELTALTSRLESVLAGGDRAAVFAYWQADQRRRSGRRTARSGS